MLAGERTTITGSNRRQITLNSQNSHWTFFLVIGTLMGTKIYEILLLYILILYIIVVLQTRKFLKISKKCSYFRLVEIDVQNSQKKSKKRS